MNEKLKFVPFVLVATTILFMIGLWNIDLAASVINTDGIVAQSLISEATSPRVIYHVGILICLTMYLIVSFILLWVVMYEEKKKY